MLDSRLMQAAQASKTQKPLLLLVLNLSSQRHSKGHGPSTKPNGLQGADVSRVTCGSCACALADGLANRLLADITEALAYCPGAVARRRWLAGNKKRFTRSRPAPASKRTALARPRIRTLRTAALKCIRRSYAVGSRTEIDLLRYVLISLAF